MTSAAPATQTSPEIDVLHPGHFAYRHIGPRREDLAEMLQTVGYRTLDEFIDAVVPAEIRLRRPLALPPGRSEREVLQALRGLAGMNRVFRSYIGMGYAGTFTPQVVQRNVLENPGWYTAYTPYQAEIAQGRLEALLNFQTMVSDLTGLPVANASMLDEATAAAEAMTLVRRAGKASSNRFVVDQDTLPQTLAVLRTRAEPLGIDLVVEELSQGLTGLGLGGDFFGILLAYPGASGAVRELDLTIADAKKHGAAVIVAADPLALTLLRPPGELGADVAVGSTQRFGVPLGFGGPHAAYLAVRKGLERQLPGRLVGVSKDADGAPAYRLALQTREQHIRREKATSNICTAQVLLAVLASMYAVYHGPDGLRRIAETAHGHARTLAASLKAAGVEVVHASFFDTITVRVPGKAAEVVAAAEAKGINLRGIDADLVGISVDETTTSEIVRAVLDVFGAK